VGVHILRRAATSRQLAEMLQDGEDEVRLAVDLQRGVVAGGGEFHADCEEALLDDGSRADDVWGATWRPASGEVCLCALINIKPEQGNRTVEVQEGTARSRIEALVRKTLGCER
jgi:hypothetical protein